MSDYHDDWNARPFEPVDEPFGRWGEAPAPQVSPAASTDPVVLDLPRLAEWLPRLGAVLWLERRERRPSPPRALIGTRGIVLLEHPALGVLGRCRSIAAHTAVTPHGPREWLSFRDARDEVRAKLFLLPDTDYLAWDEMAAATRLAPACEEPPRWHAHAAFLRGALARLGSAWRARVLRFELGRLPWLRTLDAQPPLRLSLLGLELSRAIARSEGAELVSPLHSA
jgi:hypothetical protein